MKIESPPRSLVTPGMLQESRAGSFILRLNQYLSWNLAATKGAGEWLAVLARIMGLPAGEDGALPTLWFVRGAPAKFGAGGVASVPDSHILDALETDGWLMNDLRLIRIWLRHRRKENAIICELLNTPFNHVETTMMWQSLHPIYERVMMRGGMPLHAALVTHRGKGYILAGAGGKGKTTCCERLPHDWEALGDDETLVVRFSPGKPVAHPFPTWSVTGIDEKRWNVSRNVPITTIFFLEKAEQDCVTRLGQGEAAVKINESANQSCFSRLRSLPAASRIEWRRMLFQNSCEISRITPAYTLKHTKTGQFWDIIEDVTHNSGKPTPGPIRVGEP